MQEDVENRTINFAISTTKLARNKNVLIVGGSGSGKTTASSMTKKIRPERNGCLC